MRALTTWDVASAGIGLVREPHATEVIPMISNVTNNGKFLTQAQTTIRLKHTNQTPSLAGVWQWPSAEHIKPSLMSSLTASVNDFLIGGVTDAALCVVIKKWRCIIE
jgi:hypothetical protein